MVVKTRHAKHQRFADRSAEGDLGPAALVIAARDVGIARVVGEAAFLRPNSYCTRQRRSAAQRTLRPFNTSTCPMSSVAANESIGADQLVR